MAIFQFDFTLKIPAANRMMLIPFSVKFEFYFFKYKKSQHISFYSFMQMYLNSALLVYFPVPIWSKRLK